MKLIPASRAFATIRPEVASSAGPPNIMVPRQIGEIFRPLRPRERYCIGSGPSHAKTVGRIALQDRHCEPPGRANARPMTAPAKQSSFSLGLWIASSQVRLAMTETPDSAKPSASVLQYLEHAIGGDERTSVRRHFGGDEHQT